MLKITNLTHEKDLDNAIQLIILKIDDVILVFTKKKFVNLSAKHTIQCILEKRKNIRIVKTYYLNTLLIIIIY